MERYDIAVVKNAANVCNINPETPLEKVVADCMTDYLEIRKAEEQGLLIKLPCKVGNKVYIIVHKSRVYEMEVMAIYPFGAFYEDEEKEISRIYNLFLDGNVYYKHCTFYDIGKTVFLTKEEAEKALAKVKAGENKI